MSIEKRSAPGSGPNIAPLVLFVPFVVQITWNANHDMQANRFYLEAPQTGSRPNI
jgi:hypothetical protein